MRRSSLGSEVQHIENRLDTLIDLSRTKTCIEWRTLFVGAFMSQVFAGVVPASAIQQILFVVVHGLAQMFTGFEPPQELVT
jgi:hypothetical protein